jgi:hypothetical protein
MRTFINDHAVACLVDTLDSEGFIGLQVHAVSNPGLAGRKVYFKNIRIQTSGLLNKPFPPGIYVVDNIPNHLSAYEKSSGGSFYSTARLPKVGWEHTRINFQIPAGQLPTE